MGGMVYLRVLNITGNPLRGKIGMSTVTLAEIWYGKSETESDSVNLSTQISRYGDGKKELESLQSYNAPRPQLDERLHEDTFLENFELTFRLDEEGEQCRSGVESSSLKQVLDGKEESKEGKSFSDIETDGSVIPDEWNETPSFLASRTKVLLEHLRKGLNSGRRKEISEEINKINRSQTLRELRTSISRADLQAMHKAIMKAKSFPIPQDNTVLQKAVRMESAALDLKLAADREDEKGLEVAISNWESHFQCHRNGNVRVVGNANRPVCGPEYKRAKIALNRIRCKDIETTRKGDKLSSSRWIR